MEKKIQVYIKDLENEHLKSYEVIGNVDKENKIINYFEQTKTSVILKDVNNTLEIFRENDEFKMNMTFNKNEITNGNYYLKEFDLNLDIIIKTKNLEVDFKAGIIKIDYELFLIQEKQGSFKLKLVF